MVKRSSLEIEGLPTRTLTVTVTPVETTKGCSPYATSDLSTRPSPDRELAPPRGLLHDAAPEALPTGPGSRLLRFQLGPSLPPRLQVGGTAGAGGRASPTTPGPHPDRERPAGRRPLPPPPQGRLRGPAGSDHTRRGPSAKPPAPGAAWLPRGSLRARPRPAAPGAASAGTHEPRPRPPPLPPPQPRGDPRPLTSGRSAPAGCRTRAGLSHAHGASAHPPPAPPPHAARSSTPGDAPDAQAPPRSAHAEARAPPPARVPPSSPAGARLRPRSHWLRLRRRPGPASPPRPAAPGPSPAPSPRPTPCGASASSANRLRERPGSRAAEQALKQKQLVEKYSPLPVFRRDSSESKPIINPEEASLPTFQGYSQQTFRNCPALEGLTKELSETGRKYWGSQEIGWASQGLGPDRSDCGLSPSRTGRCWWRWRGPQKAGPGQASTDSLPHRGPPTPPRPEPQVAATEGGASADRGCLVPARTAAAPLPAFPPEAPSLQGAGTGALLLRLGAGRPTAPHTPRPGARGPHQPAGPAGFRGSSAPPAGPPPATPRSAPCSPVLPPPGPHAAPPPPPPAPPAAPSTPPPLPPYTPPLPPDGARGPRPSGVRLGVDPGTTTRGRSSASGGEQGRTRARGALGGEPASAGAPRGAPVPLVPARGTAPAASGEDTGDRAPPALPARACGALGTELRAPPCALDPGAGPGRPPDPRVVALGLPSPQAAACSLFSTCIV
ncbi:basic proline-rich protein-like isoform X3 [Canis lupus familiaris]|uniref:basic proline-rich protein-like isoform X3 n=1 Tax=Canis lupus familiaris TaxID=9615 RepID=UPI0018F72E30|nr:basic proline-rich protein-like isoform X3 [Canis lupus familiaris]